MNSKKAAFILLVLILFSSFASCSESNDIPAEVTAASSETTTAETVAEISDDIGEYDFEGRAFTIIARTIIGAAVNQIAPGEANGEVINDAVFARNVKVEERFNITIEELLYPENDFPVPFRNSIKANDSAFEFAAMHIINSGVYAQEGLLSDLNGIPNISMGKPWWNQTVKDNLLIGGKLFLAQNDIPTYTVICNNHTMFFNKKLAQDFNTGNIYDMVRAGTWTLDKMSVLITGVASDLDGNGTMDEKDRYGFLGSTGSMTIFLAGCNQPIMAPDDDGIPQLVINCEKTINIVDKVYKMCFESSQVYMKPIAEEANFCNYFRDGLALFFNGYISNSNTLREMEDEYGLIPPPKYDEAQESYHTQIQGNSDLVGIPVTDNADYEFIGAVVEVLAAESYKIVRPAIYETALKNKYMRDVDSEEMLDLITTDIKVDFGFVNHGWKGFAFVIWDLMEQKSSDFASYYAKKEKTAVKQYQTVIDSLLSLE